MFLSSNSAEEEQFVFLNFILFDSTVVLYYKWREMIISLLKEKLFYKMNEKQWLPMTPMG